VSDLRMRTVKCEFIPEAVGIRRVHP
jgi:hypothetical protein